MSHTPLLTAVPPLPPPPQTSRTIVVGVGSFGLRVISLLLPRLEVFYQFVSADQERLMTRCALVSPGVLGQQTLVIERVPAALGLAREIQRLVLTDDPATDARLSQLLELDGRWQIPGDLLAWLDALVRPVLSDNWSHTSYLANLHIYLVCDDSSDLDTALALAQEIRRLPGTLFTYLLLHVGTTPGPHNPSVTKRLDRALNARLLRHIFLSHTTTAHHTRHDPPGEPAMVMCNFVEAGVLSVLADSYNEQMLPDTERLTSDAPYSVLGAAKLYVPVAEMTDAVLERFVTERLHQLMRDEPRERRNTLPHHDHPHLESICRLALKGASVWIRRRRVPLRLRAREAWLRLRQSPEAEELAVLRLAMARLPQLEVSRRYWREFYASFGRRQSEATWWQALTQFERLVRDTDLPHWLAEGSRRLGVSPQDESVIRIFAQLPQVSDPLVQLLAQATPELRAELLGQWFNAQLQHNPPGPSLRDAVLAEVFSKQRAGIALSHDQLTNSVAHLLWRYRNDQPGLLHMVDGDLRREAAGLIAGSPQGLLHVAGDLQLLRQRANAAEQDLAAWHMLSHRHAPHSAQQLANAQLEVEKQALVARMGKRPYPASLISRLLIIWLLPILLGIVVSTETVPSLPLGLILPDAVMWWTGLIIAAYTLIICAAQLDIWLTRYRIEQLVLVRLDHAVEQAIYASDPNQTPGLLTLYLRGLRRQVAGTATGEGYLPAPLLGAVEATIAEFRREEQPTPVAVPVCTAYRSVGNDLTRDLIEVYLRSELELQPSQWLAQPQQVQASLISAHTLRDHIRTTLQIQALKQHSHLLRNLPLLHLSRLLQLPENTRYDPNMYLDDLVQRARPMVDLSRVHQRAHPHGRIAYVSADVNSTNALRRSIGRSAREYSNLSYDPFGLSYTIIIYGLARESLPFT
ncbi:MAG: hypothetical protein OHK0022_19470 [Roseiflexaceae bacterium]